MLAPTDWTDAEILAAAAQAAREEFFGAQRARVGDTGAQDEARGGGVPFLLVRKQLVRLLDEMGVGLQSTRGLQVYRHLLQHVVEATVGECGHDMILFSEESRALFMPPVNGAGGTAASRLANANSWSLVSSSSVVSSGPAPVLVSASPGPSGLSDRSFNETTPRVSASSSSAPSSSSSSSPVSFSSSSGPVSSSSAFPPSSSSACPSSSSSSSSSSSFSSCSSCSSSPLASATARVQAFAARRKAGEDHRLLLDALREWRRWAAREARLRSLFWTLSSRRRLRALRRSLHAWRANFIEALSRREDSNEEAADGQRTAAVCRRSLLAWSAGVETQSAEARGQVARAAPAEEGCQRYEALQTSFRSWREATVAQREAERQRRLLSAFKAWKESHLSRRVRKQVLEHRAFAVQKSLQDRRMRGVWRHWRAAAEARSRAGAAARETLERTRFRRVFNALLAETRDRQTRRGAAVAAAEATVRERRVRRAFRAWRKVSILRRPPFAAGHSQFSSPQIVCLLKAVSALRREGASEEPGHARSLGEALLDAATARQRRDRAQRRGDRDGEETELGRDAQVDLEDAALLTLIPLHGIDLHLPKLSTAAPLMAQALRQHYLRHSFLQWRAEALRQRQFRQAARVSRLARVFRAWREETQKAKGEAAASSAVYAAQKTRILREAWRSWRMRFRRYVLFRTQCRSLQDLRLLHLKSLAFRGWCTFHRERQREAHSVSAVKARAAAALQRAAWSRWQEAWHLRRRRRAMAEAAALLREKTLLAKGLRGLKRQRASAASLRDAAAALRQERLGLALAVWWRWAARRGAFQELCELQRAKRARRNLRRLLLAWRSLAKRMETRRDAVWRLAAVVDRIRVRRGFCGWNALRMQERKRKEAASRLQRTLRDARIRAAWAAWRSAQSLACKEAELRKESEDSLKRRVFKQWQAAAAEHATLQLHLRGQLLCWRLSRLLHRWRRLATLFRLGLLQKSRSRLYVLRRCQEAWLARLAERSEERRKEARAESLCLALRLRAAQRCLLAWQETAAAVAARRRKGDTFRAQLHRARLDAAWTTWRRGVEELHRRRRLLLGVEKIREKILVAQSLTRWKCAAALLRKEALATQARRQALLRRALQAWTLWRRRRTEKKDEAERVRACLNEEGSAKRAGERQRKKETLAAWHALTEKRFEERRAFSRVEAIGARLSLRRGFVTWRLWALRLAGLSQATVRLDVWRRRCLLRISYEALSQHRDRVKEMELASLAHLSQLRAQTLRRSFCSWRTQFAALRREAEVLARRRSAAARAEAHAALACKRRSFLAWLKALAAKLALKKRLFVLLKERREALEARTLRAWRRLAKKKGDLRESLEMFSDSRRSQCLRRVFAAVVATVSRRRLVRVRFLFALGLLAPSPDFSVSSAESSHPHSRSLLLPLSPLGQAEEASLRLLWGPALPAPLLAPRLIPRLPGPSRAFESAKECPSVLASLPLVPRLIVWSAQPHMLHLLLLQPAIAESLARQAGQQPQRSAAFFEPLPVSRARLALFSDADAEARTRVWGLPAASLGGEETPGGDKGNGALPLAALASARSRPPSVWSCLTPSTCTPHTSLSVPLSGFEAPPPRPGRTFFRTETGDTLGSARSQFRGRSASPLHSDGPSGREAGGRRHRSATKERDREDREEIDELLLADKKSSKSLERLLRCFSAKQGPEGPLKENAELWGEQAVLADSVRRMRPQNDLQALLLAQVNLSRRPSVQRPAPLFLPSAMGPDAAVSDALDASQDSVESDGSAGGLSVHSEETPLPSKNWREEIPVDLLATAWQFARLLQAALRAWLLQAQRHKAQRLRETGLVAGFRIQSRSRLLAACWGLWRSTKSSLEARTRTKAQRLAWGVQRRVLQAWFLCATVDASAVLRAEAFAETRRSAKTHAMLEAWRAVATKRRQEREQVEAWRQHRARERKQELFALWTHLASVNRAGAQLYVHRRAATLNKVFATWRTSTLRSLALDKLQRIVSRPGLFLGFSLLRIWSLTRACSLRLAAQCLDSWRQHTESRKRLAGLLVYVQTVHKVRRQVRNALP
uniref:Uncharacterized protein n=1 Tax=Toxoplasma gondii COUG TaxID=1074873 RepID=A0A2G8YAD5_TOXGO|nr:hypothetical protein TGCOUG_274000A [Toxoplasma gondii COUG]